jgi:rod shape-determining protein MreD
MALHRRQARPLLRRRVQRNQPFLRTPQYRNRILNLRPKTIPTSVPITYTSGEQIEVYRFSLPVTVGVPLIALFLQAFLPRRIFSIFDLPLLVTIFFAMARRNPISGLFTGAAIGLAQDMLGPYPIGIYGIAKTVVGFGASSLGAKLDVENAGARLLVTLGFYLIHQAVYFTVARGMVNLTLNWSWSRGILAGLANGVVGMVLYFVLDKFKQRT